MIQSMADVYHTEVLHYCPICPLLSSISCLKWHEPLQTAGLQLIIGWKLWWLTEEVLILCCVHLLYFKDFSSCVWSLSFLTFLSIKSDTAFQIRNFVWVSGFSGKLPSPWNKECWNVLYNKIITSPNLAVEKS